MTEYSVAMTESVNDSLQKFLLKDLDDEEICFATWHPAEGKSRFSILINDIILPCDDERERHGNVSALPQYLDRVKEFARLKNAGLIMIHTHPFGKGHQHVSEPDLYYEQDVLAREIFGYTGLPLVGMTLAGDSTWSARIYPKPYLIQWCSSVRIVGKNLHVDFHPKLKPAVSPNEKHVRTSNIWGNKKHMDLMRLKVGIIGSGSVGAIIGESISRMGVGHVHLMDYDLIKLHNLDRLICVSKNDVGKKKADVISEKLRIGATNDNFLCTVSYQSIVEEIGYVEALDYDVLFCCVDRPWPRQVLNHLAYSSLIPVINGGIDFRVSDGRFVHGMFRAQTVGPHRPCMNCLNTFKGSEVQQDRDGLFDDPEYIKEQEKISKTPSRQNIMPFVFGLGFIETTQFIELVTNLANIGDLGQQEYDYRSSTITAKPSKCLENCPYVSITSFGDTNKPFLGHDISKDRTLKEEIF